MTPRHGEAPVRRPPDESMTLLNEVMLRPLDPGYQRAADRREGRPPVPPARRRAEAVVVVVVAAALGLVITAATLALRAPQPGVIAARTLLENQIESRSAAATRLRESNAAVSEQISALQERALTTQDPGLLDQLAADEVTAGAVPVTGRGLRIVLADAPDSEDDPDARVQDVDLQILVNGLWAGGAEAVAVNDQRLTSLTAIRSAGAAILVDLVPLVGPYTVEAIGDPADLQTSLARSAAGQHLATLRNTFGITAQVSSQRKLELPGSGTTTLQHATVPESARPGDTASPKVAGPTGPSGVGSSGTESTGG